MIPPVRSGVYSVGSAESKTTQNLTDNKLQRPADPKREQDSSGSDDQNGGDNSEDAFAYARSPFRSGEPSIYDTGSSPLDVTRSAFEQPHTAESSNARGATPTENNDFATAPDLASSLSQLPEQLVTAASLIDAVQSGDVSGSSALLK